MFVGPPQPVRGVYNPHHRMGPTLELTGKFSLDVVQKELFNFHPYACSDEDPSEGAKGRATFLVNDETAALSLVDALNEKIKDYGYLIKYNTTTFLS